MECGRRSCLPLNPFRPTRKPVLQRRISGQWPRWLYCSGRIKRGVKLHSTWPEVSLCVYRIGRSVQFPDFGVGRWIFGVECSLTGILNVEQRTSNAEHPSGFACKTTQSTARQPALDLKFQVSVPHPTRSAGGVRILRTPDRISAGVRHRCYDPRMVDLHAHPDAGRDPVRPDNPQQR